LEYLLSELTTPGAEHRPPLLLTIDGLDHWMGPSKYHAADHSIIHSHQFATIRTFLSKLFNSTTSLGNGGIALAATTASNTPAFPTFAPLLNQVTALSNGTAPTDPSFPLPAPYQKVDSTVLGLLDPKAQTQIMQLKGVSRAEAGTLLGYYWRSGVLQEPLSAADVAERWTLAGGGVVGELARVGQSARIDVNKVLTKWGSAEGVKQGQGEHRPRR
jgi:small subunit ribosomal protein S29